MKKRVRLQATGKEKNFERKSEMENDRRLNFRQNAETQARQF